MCHCGNQTDPLPYLWQFDFTWNTRELNDGERIIQAMRAAEGKRLMYRQPA